VDTPQLTTKLFRRTQIDAADLSAVDWTDLACEEAHFTACTFTNTQFAGTNLAAARFDNCTFTACRFTRAELQEARFEACRFLPGAIKTEGCTFTFTNMRATRFLRCDLSLARIERSDLFDITMDQCTLRGATFHKLDFSQAYSRKLITTRATFRHCNLELADLTQARLPGCDLTGSRLREADLTEADLTGAILRDTDLFQATLTNTKLANADLRGAEISGLNLRHLATYAGLKISQGQQHILLDGIGIDVQIEKE